VGIAVSTEPSHQQCSVGSIASLFEKPSALSAAAFGGEAVVVSFERCGRDLPAERTNIPLYPFERCQICEAVFFA
jgi:hypothetical protein